MSSTITSVITEDGDEKDVIVFDGHTAVKGPRCFASAKHTGPCPSQGEDTRPPMFSGTHQSCD